MATSDKAHWEQIYREKSVEEVSWYRPHLNFSFDLIRQTGGGFVLIGTFALDGPRKCSGLEVQRYSAEMLRDQFGKRFTLLSSRHELHHTPSGKIQSFNYVLMQRSPK
jgi:hypothetical protein